MRVPRRLAATGIAMVLAGLSLAAQSRDPVFAVAVVRIDGVLVPIGTRSAGEWSSGAYYELANRSGDDRRDNPTYIWRMRRGDSPIELRTLELAPVESHCGVQGGLRTDMPDARTPPPYTAPVEKAGLAVQGSVPIEHTVDARDKEDEQGRMVRGLIARVAHREERPWVPSAIPQNVRERRTVELLKLQRHSIRGTDWYYFEAQKHYPEVKIGDGCELKVVVTGWVARVHDQTPRAFRPISVPPDCDGKFNTTARVLGVVPFGDRAAWILEEDQYESESYVVVEVLSDRLFARRMLEVDGGGC